MVKAFYKENTDDLIIAPFRCGSSHLASNVANYKLLYLDPERNFDRKMFEDILRTCKNKTFLWRDPLERITSYYYTFFFSKLAKNSKGAIVKSTADNKNVSDQLLKEITKEKIYTGYFWNDFKNSWQYMKKYLHEDAHIVPYTVFFKTTNENFLDYNIINVDDFHKFIFLNFSEKLPERKDGAFQIVSTMNISMSEVIAMLDIRKTIHEVYHDDYLLEPLIQKL